MKTTRDHSSEKLQKEKAKWSRQVSMYADLLKQSYPEFDVKPENLRIIPINVSYPSPRGTGRGLNPVGIAYSVAPKGQSNEGQLQMTDKGGNTTDYIIDNPNDFEMRNTEVNGQFQPGYTHFNINWDNLSSEDQEIAASLEEQTSASTEEQPSTPSKAEVLTPQRRRSTLDADIFNEEWEDGTIEAAPKVTPIIGNELHHTSISWSDLNDNARKFLQEEGWAGDESAYNEILDDIAAEEAMKNELKCRGLL